MKNFEKFLKILKILELYIIEFNKNHIIKKDIF